MSVAKKSVDDFPKNEKMNLPFLSFWERRKLGALVAQSVERVLGKDEVGSSSLLGGSISNFQHKTINNKTTTNYG